jgi:hypothetical protein
MGVVSSGFILYYYIKSVERTIRRIPFVFQLANFSFTTVSEPPLTILPGCNVKHSSPILFVCFATFLLFEIRELTMSILPSNGD